MEDAEQKRTGPPILYSYNAHSGAPFDACFASDTPMAKWDDIVFHPQPPPEMRTDLELSYQIPLIDKLVTAQRPHFARGGDKLTITGRNFGPREHLADRSKVKVYFNLTAGADGVGMVPCRKLTYVNDQTLECITPSGEGAGRDKTSAARRNTPKHSFLDPEAAVASRRWKVPCSPRPFILADGV